VRVRLVLGLDRGLTITGARVALYNWLAARHAGGSVVLCDRAGSADPPQLGLDDLTWLGLDWDEGPWRVAARLDRYREVASELRSAGLGHPLWPDEAPSRPLIDAVDAHDLQISHVILDASQQEHAGLRQAVCAALGWTPPHEVTLPPLVAADPLGPLAAYRERGYQPLAMANHVARLGWMPRGKQRLISLNELAERFDLERLSHSPCPFDPGRLDWFNHRVLRQFDPAALAQMAAPCWIVTYGAAHRAEGTALSPAEWQNLLAEALRDELHNLDEIPEKARFAFLDRVDPDAEAQSVLAQAYARPILRAFVDALPGVAPFDAEPIDAFASELRWRFKEALGIRSRDVMHVLRAALTGRVQGPCLYAIIQLLGRRRCIERAERTLADLTG
jgi:glutamyl/glutaminyl-tRNA synthetase